PRLLQPGQRPNRASFAADLPPGRRLAFLLQLLVTPTAADPSSLRLPAGCSVLYAPLHPLLLATRRLFPRCGRETETNSRDRAGASSGTATRTPG
ncbi:hypothetical protein, partial [Methylacidimicrobium cyclopophantes]|uniref:hypothetical protein n=1 Tax=Methylacidimicrobium cyclopophantes TaxID=1041766 RepID=UPI0015B4255E